MDNNQMNDFGAVINKLAAHFGWNTDQIDQDEAAFDFKVDSGNEKTLYLYYDEGSVEFNVPSEYGFEDAENAPHEVSTILLRRNADLEVGSWILEDEEDGDWVYSLVWDIDLETLGQLEFEDVESIIQTMLEEVDDFDRSLDEEEEE